MSNESNESSPRDGNRFALGCLGAILIHPLLFILAFLKGFVLGSAQEYVMSATGGSGPTKYLFEGGFNAMGNLFIYYIFVGFVVIPVTSLIGGAVTVAIGKQWSQSSLTIDVLKSPAPPFAVYSRKLRFWAAALYIISYCFSNLLLQIEDAVSLDLWGLIVGCKFIVWMIGAISAFFFHRDWRISVWIVGIYMCLFLMRNWLPGFGLLIASVGAILCLLSYSEKTESDGSESVTDSKQFERNALGGLSVFIFGGVTYYTLLCLYCLSWALSSRSGGDDWAPFMFLVVGVWGFPIAGGITLLLYRRTSVSRWVERKSRITNRVIWIAIAAEGGVCVISWISAALYG